MSFYLLIREPDRRHSLRLGFFRFALFQKRKICYPTALSAFPYTSQVSVFDLIILAILAALTLRGIWKGMVSQIISVASYFVCWIVATRFGSLIAPTVPLEAPWDQVAAMAVLFVITLIAIRFAHAALEKLIKHWHLDKLNKSLGGLLGFTKGLLLCLIITFFAVMFSETSRAVVFNSISGSRLVQLITQISLFVPKDSYEFVHTQFAQFQSKVDAAVPGQTPETLPVQSSEAVKEVLARLQPAKETNTGSLLTALSKWWNGTKEETSEAEKSVSAPQTAQKSEQPKNETKTLSAATYVPQTTPVFLADTSAAAPQAPAPQQPPVDAFFVRQTPAAGSPLGQQPLAQQLAALPALPDVPAPQQSSPLTSLAALAPLSESLPSLPSLSALSETAPLLPTLPVPGHVGSDLLLRNSGQPAAPNSSAKVFPAQ